MYGKYAECSTHDGGLKTSKMGPKIRSLRDQIYAESAQGITHPVNIPRSTLPARRVAGKTCRTYQPIDAIAMTPKAKLPSASACNLAGFLHSVESITKSPAIISTVAA
jgi:hypothetical protein